METISCAQFLNCQISKPALLAAYAEWMGVTTLKPDSPEALALVGDADLHARAWDFCLHANINPQTVTDTGYRAATGLNEAKIAAMYHLGRTNNTFDAGQVR